MLSVGLIGTGTISHAHLSAYLDLQEEVRIVALADIAAEKAEPGNSRHDAARRGAAPGCHPPPV
ncbi:hypothetical protein FM106_00315 [Brachybacterium faecium]|nr:hypothetical protein FM106_00315 [Brachybacterium faecium]